MNYTKQFNENKNITGEYRTLTKNSPTFYSFGTCIFSLIKKLSPTQRNKLKNMFVKCHDYVKDNDYFEYEKEDVSKFSYSDSLISNLIYLINFPEIPDKRNVKLGACVSMSKLMINEKREFNKIKKSVFFDDELHSFSNKKLLRLYKKTLTDFNKSIHLINNNQEYSREFDKNERLSLKEHDILKEFKRRVKISKFCKVFDSNENPQGYVYFIPKIEEDDIFVALYKHEPYSIREFKKKNLHVKREDGNIRWG